MFVILRGPVSRSEMARRASETAFFEDDGARSTSTPEHGRDGGSAEGGSAVVEDAEAGIAPRKSFVMKRVWGGMKMVEVGEEDGLLSAGRVPS